MFLILTVSSIVKPSTFNVMAVIGLLSWTASRRQLEPNAVALIIVQATLGGAEAILSESALSFFGLGVQLPTASWGKMFADARNITVLQSQLWL